MFSPWDELNVQHPDTEMCSRGAERKCRVLVEDEAHMGVAEAFQSYGRSLEVMSLFKYLGRILTASDND